ncbi:amidohydrolase [Streptomyces sp. MS06]|uniref:amidohydrolase n=1 Tax=Streptomyces sp. MS06 TaxID=3385974 RepID=UPI0039A37D5F
MQPWLAGRDVTVDESLADKVILPGFVEPHTHFWMSAGFMAMSFIGPIPMPGPEGMNAAVPTAADVIVRLREVHEQETDPTKPIIAWGFDPAIQGGSLDRKTLDAISDQRPIWVIAVAPHFVFLNSPAIEKTGVTADTDVHGVERYPDGSLNGIFNETLAVQAGLAPVFGEIQRRGGLQGLHFMAGIARDAGITTTCEMMLGAIDLEAELADTRTATSDPDFPVRMRLVPLASMLESTYGDGVIDAHRKLAEGNTDRMMVQGVKFNADGSLPLMSSLVNFPGYLDGRNGSVNDTPWDQMVDRMTKYWKAGIQIHCHANGDESVDAVLDSLAGLQALQPRFDHRFSIEHYSISNPMQARRLKALGGIASVNNYFAHFRALLHRSHAYGPDRSDTFARLGTLEREGVTFALHSDYPQVAVPLLPLTAVWAAVTRLAEDDETVVAPDERIGVERAMRAITVDAAYILGLEDKVGSLEQGKFADFTVLEEDPFDVDPKHIKDIKIWGTALSGKLFKATGS